MSEELMEFIRQSLDGVKIEDINTIARNLIPSLDGNMKEAMLIGKLIAFKPLADRLCSGAMSCKECSLQKEFKCYYYYLWTKYGQDRVRY